MAELIGTDDAEIIEGDGGEDTIVGGMGGDLLLGGGGSDLFVIDDGDSPAATALGDPDFVVDVIGDWSPDDHLSFTHARPVEADSLFAGVAADYGAAYDLAQSAFDDGFEYASIKVGADVYVFAPRVDSVVQLAGVDLADVTSASLAPAVPDGEATTLSAQAELFDGGDGSDTVQGLAGADTLMGRGGDDQVFGGSDNDSIDGGEGANYLRGDEGDDAVLGGAGHDDINGNMGRDTLFAGSGDDWVRGGKDDDIVFGNGGDDLVFGDIGDDTCGGGLGDDVLHGGVGRDIVRGDDGDDTLIGDGGNDTLDGGVGADVFVATADGSVDVVSDFRVADGDRVQIDAGASYTLSQDGGDTIIDFGAGGQMVLQGVQMSDLTPGWIVGG